MVKQTAKVIRSDATTGAQVILAGRTTYTVMYDSNGMLSYIEVEGGAKFSDKELLSLIARTTLLRVSFSTLFPNLRMYDIRLEGGTTQILQAGLWTVVPMTDVYVVSHFLAAGMHLEIYDGVVWRDWSVVAAAQAGVVVTVLTDGTLIRAANGQVPASFVRLVGVRAW